MFLSISNLAGTFSDPYSPSPIDDSSSYEPDGYNAEAAEPVFAVDWLVAPTNQFHSPSEVPFDTATTGMNPEGLSFDRNTHFLELCQQLKQREDISEHAYYLCSQSEFLKAFTHRHTMYQAPPIYGEFVSDRLSECFLSFIQRFVSSCPLMFGTCLFLNKFFQYMGVVAAIEQIHQMETQKYRLLAGQLERCTFTHSYLCNKKYFLLPYVIPLSKSELIQLSTQITT